MWIIYVLFLDSNVTANFIAIAESIKSMQFAIVDFLDDNGVNEIVPCK